MKDPQKLFPFLFASSWLGDLVLTVLAFFLAFSHSGPLTPLVFLTVAFCILSGNLLPIGAYLIFTRWREAVLRTQSMEVELRVRDALKRSEEILARLDVAEGALSKAVLVARQVPERIGERMQDLERLSEAVNTEELTALAESISQNTQSSETLKTEAGTIRESISELKRELSEIPEYIGKAVKDAIPDMPKAGEAREEDVSLSEQLDLVFESLESVQDTLDSLLERIARIEAAPPAKKAARKKAAPKPKPAGEPEPETVDKPAADPAPEPDPEPEPELKEPDPPQQEMELVGDSEPLPANGDKPVNPDVVSLSVHAMIGMRNKLYIRGDEPWLSWDAGQPMELVGIGEFSWESGEPGESIEVAVYLNDETPAKGGPVRLEPGKPVRIEPEFL